jgi:hypothetical protein
MYVGTMRGDRDGIVAALADINVREGLRGRDLHAIGENKAVQYQDRQFLAPLELSL